MELSTFMAALSVVLLLLLASSVSADDHGSLHGSQERVHRLDKVILPRKKLIQLNAEAPVVKNASDDKEDKCTKPSASGTTFSGNAEYFNMDYGWVRSRRPIHNKQTPFVP